MTIREMIAEWRTGCSCGGPQALEGRKDHPGDCVECTEALIDCIEKSLREKEAKRARVERFFYGWEVVVAILAGTGFAIWRLWPLRW